VGKVYASQEVLSVEFQTVDAQTWRAQELNSRNSENISRGGTEKPGWSIL